MGPGIGHNSGRSGDAGTPWRAFAWRRSRAALIPNVPVEIVRLRVKRAAALGLAYKTYAGFRAQTGHDLVGFLFSSNALRVMKDGQRIPDARAVKLSMIKTDCRLAAAHPPVTAGYLSGLSGIDAAGTAPAFSVSWSQMRRTVVSQLVETGFAPDRFVVVGDTSFEAEWAEAARTAGFLRSDQYFAQH